MNPPTAQPFVHRLASIDAYRGFVMFLIMAEVLHLSRISDAVPESVYWKTLSFHQTHVPWVGCSLHDLIQPSFSFLVGVALPFSIAGRPRLGQSRLGMTVHAAWRALVLVFLGVFLRSIGHSQTRFTFEDTLSQIGLGYLFLFAVGLRPRRDQWIALVLILVGYWAAFARICPPPPTSTTRGVEVPQNWPHNLSGFAGHWNKNTNLAWAFDSWFLNLFSRVKPFVANSGGYSTLSFIPTLGTMILGLIAGGVLRSERTPLQKVSWLVVAGAMSIAAGWLLGVTGVCPVVKRIWTPSWVLFSGGWCLWLLAAWYAVIDVGGWKAWAFPFIVIGMNSIAAYCMSGVFECFCRTTSRLTSGPKCFNSSEPLYPEPFARRTGRSLLVLWLILLWMYRRRIFLRI